MQPTSLAQPYSDKIPVGTPPLFHYTDAGGLLGMVQSKKMWLTNVHYQNDEEEYHYAFKLVNDVLKKYYASHFSSDRLAYHQYRMGAVYSFSLSEERDSLSQWRGYAPNGGYSISFKSEKLNMIMKQNNLLIGKCIYSRQEQEEFIINQIIRFTPAQRQEVIDRKYQKMPFIMDSSYFYDRLLKEVMQVAPLLKHSSFSDEKEWRLFKSTVTVSDPPHLLSDSIAFDKLNEVKVRARKNILIPYIEVPLATNPYEANELVELKQNRSPLELDRIVGLQEIVVGPTPHKHLALEACKILMSTAGYFPRSIDVSSSAIPYVNW